MIADYSPRLLRACMRVTLPPQRGAGNEGQGSPRRTDTVGERLEPRESGVEDGAPEIEHKGGRARETSPAGELPQHDPGASALPTTRAPRLRLPWPAR
jgi:hypothetical protein